MSTDNTRHTTKDTTDKAMMLATMYPCSSHVTTSLRSDLSINKKGCACKYKIEDTPTTEQWEDHITGLNTQKGLGIYTTNPDDNTVRFGVIDVDIFKSKPEHDGMIDKPTPMQSLIIEYIKHNNLPLIPYYSRSGGLHLTIYCKEDVPAYLLRQLLAMYICEMFDAGIFNTVEEKTKQGLPLIALEIFPKQDTINKDGFGNFIWAPFIREGHLNQLAPHLSRPVNGATIREAYTFYCDNAVTIEQINNALDGQLPMIQAYTNKFKIDKGYPKIKLDEGQDEISLGSTSEQDTQDILAEDIEYRDQHMWGPYFFFESIHKNENTQNSFCDIATFITKLQEEHGFTDDAALEIYTDAINRHRDVLSVDRMKVTSVDQDRLDAIWDRRHSNSGYVSTLGKGSYRPVDYDDATNTVTKKPYEPMPDAEGKGKETKELRSLNDNDIDMLDEYVVDLTNNAVFYPVDMQGVDINNKMSLTLFNSSYLRRFAGTKSFPKGCNMINVYQDLKPHLIGRGLTYKPYAGLIVDGAVNKWRDSNYKRDNTKLILPEHNPVVKTLYDEIYILCSGILEAGGDTNDLNEAVTELKLATAYTIAAQDRKLKRAILLYGRPGTGKSTYCDIISKAVGPHNTAQIRKVSLTAGVRFNSKEAFRSFIHYAELSQLTDDIFEGMKDRITNNIMASERKTYDEVDVEDCANRWISSNKSNFFQVEVVDGRIETYISGELPPNKKEHFNNLHNILEDEEKMQVIVDWACAVVHNQPNYDLNERKPEQKGTILMQGYSTLSDLGQDAHRFIHESGMMEMLPHPNVIPMTILCHAIAMEGQYINSNPESKYYNFFTEQHAAHKDAKRDFAEAFNNVVRTMYIESGVTPPTDMVRQVSIGYKPNAARTRVIVLPGYVTEAGSSIANDTRDNLVAMYNAGLLPKVKNGKQASLMKTDSDLYNIISRHAGWSSPAN